ncbi:MAG: ABC transporter permease [Lachnospiraceae bacterium]|jgi:putative ABC transport system permease protein|nr:ABC transporter permease [Lachnospiraceae bacterium]MBR2756149.1 ABC transporter permease [Lachnospiraceae bacterium]MBR3359952.1 ABC transporter permease [Lachnospiraceae bacterium]MBR3362255.1 ABC transporter permease [Lachnospiraceae bacterium]MBR6357751.1 ABC transporter permease [Lachnospiraceae bacterium]
MTSYLCAISFGNLVTRLPGGISQGLVWGLMALGVFITFRILDVADLSVDGSFATGGAVAVMLMIAGVPAWAATLIALCAGLVAGLITGLLHAKLGIPAILAGILTQFALYSINLRIMGMSSNQSLNPNRYKMVITMRNIPMAILIGVIISAVIIAILYWYFGTEQGSAIRATGTNNEMSLALGINTSNMKILGLILSNGLVALAGALMAQYQGFSDVNMGRGAIVIGLAAIIIGEILCDAIFKKGCNFAIRLAFVVVGGIIYYIVMVIILWLRLDPNDLKLFTAIIVAAFLAIPYLRGKSKNSFGWAGKRSLPYVEAIKNSLRKGV